MAEVRMVGRTRETYDEFSGKEVTWVVEESKHGEYEEYSSFDNPEDAKLCAKQIIAENPEKVSPVRIRREVRYEWTERFYYYNIDDNIG